MSEKEIAFTAHAFQTFLDQGKLMASRCLDCHKIYLPVRALCPECYQSNLEWVELNGRGKLVAYTSIYIGPSFMINLGFNREKPYLTGIVELDEGLRISARLLGLAPENPAAVKIGTSMTFSGIEIGEDEKTHAQLAFQAVE